MRPFAGGAFPRWLKQVYPGLEAQVDVSRLMGGLLASVLSSPLTDVALVGMRSVERVEQSCAIVEDFDKRVDVDGCFYPPTAPGMGWEINPIQVVSRTELHSTI